MLSDFIVSHRESIIRRIREQLRALAGNERRDDEELSDGLPEFLDAVTAAVAGPARGNSAELQRLAAIHSRHRVDQGYSIENLVRDYGAICDAVTGLADEQQQPIAAGEFQRLNYAIDDGIAAGVMQFCTPEREARPADWNERLGFIAHELRNAAQAATLAFDALRSGRVGVNSQTAEVVSRAHQRLRNLSAGLSMQVKATAGRPDELGRIPLLEVLGESMQFVAELARAKEITVRSEISGAFELDADRGMLLSAFTNLLQNAIKFSRRGGCVAVRMLQPGDGRVAVEIEDECGGLPEGMHERLFAPFVQAGPDRSGMGLGLALTRQVVESHHGGISVKDLPGRGCIFTVDLPLAKPD
ncbi:MAG TPA: sensor histidine kinase [Myxococcales bacterium]|nr:sensor histidine kinase [Myxococcales bacterium]